MSNVAGPGRSATVPAVGLSIPEEVDAPGSVAMALAVEAAGLDAAWFTEVERDPFVRCAAALAQTRLRVGTGVAQWTRTPVTAAMTAAELDELSGGRFTFGLGTGTAYVSENFHGISFDRPARRMSEYVRAIRAVWAAGRGSELDFEGERSSIRGFSQPYFEGGPPLVLAAVGAGMLRLAGRRADGVIFNPSTTPWFLRNHARPHLEEGFRQAGRTDAGFERIVCLRCAVDPDRATARNRARRGIADYGRYPVHQRQYRLYGWGAEAARIEAAMSRGDEAAAVAAVSEEMVDALSLAGTADEVRRRLGAWTGLVDAVSLVPPTLGIGADELRANGYAIIGAFER